MTRERFFEGVRYTRFRVTYKATSGKRRAFVFWSPGAPWVASEARRALQERGDYASNARLDAHP